MKGRGKIKHILIALVFFNLVGFVGYKLLKYIWNVINSVNSDIAVAIIAGSVTLLVSTLTVVISNLYENHKTTQERLREKKIPVYEGVMEFYFEMLFNKEKLNYTGKQKEKHEKELVEQYGKFTRQIISWGSDEIIIAWSDLRKATLANDKIDRLNTDEVKEQTKRTVESVAKLALALREDIGHKNIGVNEMTILSMFLNDVENVYE